MKQILERKQAIILLLSEADQTHNLLSSDVGWEIATAIVPILEVIEIQTFYDVFELI